MPFFINRNFENQLYEYLSSIQSWVNARPINLGGMSGPGGGSGGPWGFIGQLPQSRVTYDTSELSASGLPASGWSLLDNLNHIRYRIDTIVAGSMAVQWEDVEISPSITVLNFEGAVTVVDSGAGKATITVLATASGMPAGDSVVYETSFGQSPASGVSNLYSRADHTHGTPSAPASGIQPTREVIFSVSDALIAATGNLRMYNQLGSNFHINKVFIAVNTPPGGTTVIRVDINNNGSSIFTTEAHQPTIAIGAYTGVTTTIDLPDFDDGDYLTLDLDQVGNVTPGSDLTACVILESV